jgi:hypothetical protein
MCLQGAYSEFDSGVLAFFAFPNEIKLAIDSTLLSVCFLVYPQFEVLNQLTHVDAVCYERCTAGGRRSFKFATISHKSMADARVCEEGVTLEKYTTLLRRMQNDNMAALRERILAFSLIPITNDPLELRI